MACPCCAIQCPCSDNAPKSFYVTVQNMNGIDQYFHPAFAGALKANLVGVTFELSRPFVSEAFRLCRDLFVYESESGGCSPSPSCTDSTVEIRFRAFPMFFPATNRYYLTLDRLASVPGVGSGCAFVAGRQGVSSGLWPNFSVTGTEFNCTSGSAQAQLWNNCSPGSSFWFKAADVFIEW